MTKSIVSKIVILATIISLLPLAYAGELPKTAAEMGIMQGSPPERLIDMSKWDKGPDNRWAFQHISEIIPTANISRGTGVPSELHRTPQDLSGLVFKTDDGKKMTVNEMLNATYTDGFIVLHNGKVVFEKYYNGMKPDTRHLLMSVSKSVTGTLAGILVMDGRLNPDAKIIEYIPELKNSQGFADATVREVLDMTTSIVFSEDYDDPNAEIVSHEEATAWRGRTPLAEKGLYAFAQTIKKDKREHGELFHYASINTDVLGWLIERASGQRYIDFMSDTIWSKLGAEHDAHISVDYLGSAVANGGFCITLRDLARFAQMVLDDGYYNGKQIVSSGWIDDIRFNGKNSAWKPTKYGKIWPNGFYRNQWYVTKDNQGSFFAIGVNGQHIWINPTNRVVIVKFSSLPKSADVESGGIAISGMDAIARSFGKQ
jgi:hypothetical protein